MACSITRTCGRPHVLFLPLTRDGRLADEGVLGKIRATLPSVTDCFLFCDGWVNDRAGAKHRARRFFDTLEGWLAPLHDRVVPLRVTLHWSSKPFQYPDLSREASDGGLWPDLERQLVRAADTQSGDLGRLLLELMEAEIPGGPEEEAELDWLGRTLHEAHIEGRPLLRLFHALSIWVMKRRAGQVGERVGREHWAPLWESLQAWPRLHLIGHSFGARLLTSAILGGIRPESLILLQAPFSAFAFAPEVPGYDRPGAYHRVLAERQVAGPIVAVRSTHDGTLRVLYPLMPDSRRVNRRGRALRTKEIVARSAIGAVGIRGVDAPEFELKTARQTGLPYRRVVNVDGSGVIGENDGSSGQRPDIFHPEIAALVLIAGGLLQGHPDGIRPRPVSPLAA